MSLLKPKVVLAQSPSLSPEAADYNAAPKLGVMHLDFKVYIEGVQVPFESVIVSNSYGSLPTASITVPYMPFLQEIGRNYPAKVHVFFKDVISERYLENKDSIANKDIHNFRLLFSGVIKGAYYTKSKDVGAGSTTISFQCAHKNYVASEIQLSLARFNLSDTSAANFDAAAVSTAGISVWNPQLVAQQALQGVDSTGSTVFTPSILQSNAEKEDEANTTHGVPGQLIAYANQFAGVPGTILRLWNIMCKDSYTFAYKMDFMKKIYVPLMYNIKYFEGMVGHPIVETYLEKNKLPASSTVSDTSHSYLNPRGMYESDAAVTSLGAVSIDATIMAVMAGISQSISTTPFNVISSSIAQSLMYDVTTLSSPAMRVKDLVDTGEIGDSAGFLDVKEPVCPVETIVHPSMNLYFAPACNVLYPNMYTQIAISDLYDDAPTRIMSNTPPIAGMLNVPISFVYRSPYNVREAVYNRSLASKGTVVDVINTVEIYEETPASHEMGRGVHARPGVMPTWAQYITGKSETGPRTIEAKADWRKMLMDYNDYQYSVALSSYRTGQVSAVFNPFIVVGYPMDVVDPSPLRPSHHGFCTSVTHNISSSSVSTQISFSNAITFEELYVFDTPMTLPWIADLLKIRKLEDGHSYTSIASASKEARDAADTYYRDVLGVGAAFIDDLSEYKYADDVPTRGIKQVNKVMGSVEDAVAACRRSIQTQANVEALYGIKFIDTIGKIAVGSQGVRDFIFKPTADTADTSHWNTARVPPGHNMFLDYSNYVVSPEKTRPLSPPQVFDITGSRTTSTTQSTADASLSPDVSSITNWQVKSGWVEELAKLKSTRPDHYAAFIRLDGEMQSIPYYLPGAWLQVISAESHYKEDSLNNTSKDKRLWAYGYGQILPRWHDGVHAGGKLVKDLTPMENILASASIFKSCLKATKNINDAVVAYNQGTTTVLNARKSGGGVCYYKDCGKDRGGLAYFHLIFKQPTGS